MKVFTCTGFDGHYPVGTAAVIVDESAEAALQQLNDSLVAKGLVGDATIDMIVPVKTRTRACTILLDGNY